MQNSRPFLKEGEDVRYICKLEVAEAAKFIENIRIGERIGPNLWMSMSKMYSQQLPQSGTSIATRLVLVLMATESQSIPIT